MMGRETNAEILRRLRAEAVARGDCMECRGRPAIAGRKHCRTCLDRQAARKARNRAEGRCACGRPTRHGRTACVACANSQARSGQRILERRRNNGLCMRCGAWPALTDQTMCAVCSANNRVRSQKLTATRRDLGVCRECGKHPPWDKPGPNGKRALCRRCTMKMRKRKRLEAAS
jgi:hypothetical protein